MTHFRCPICGKLASVNQFPPDLNPTNIMLVEFKGMGRGKGFRIAGEYEADPDFVEQVGIQCIEVAKHAGLGIDIGEASALEEIIEELEAKIKNLKGVLDELMEAAGLNPDDYDGVREKVDTLKGEIETLVAGAEE